MTHNRPWWTGAVGYEVYPRSFADSNGDGIGDLEGIREKLPYLAWLGVDAVWIAPFYASPGFDHGYDVSDYTAVDPAHGSLADVDRLIEEATTLGLRVIVDIVPNHTSSHHPWFRRALESRDDQYRDYYLWRDPAPSGGPPNNWVSHFGGPAWTVDEASGQYYCHLYLPEQPDLNWESPAVWDEFDRILTFWCERGVSGFRIDVAYGLVKDPLFRDNPQIRDIENPNDPREVFSAFEHLHDFDQDGNVDIYRHWNRVVAPYQGILIGEIGVEDEGRIARYVKGGDALHTVFYLRPAKMEWDPATLLRRLRAVHDEAPEGISWVVNNHDCSRSVSRWGGDDEARFRSLAVVAFQFGLGGVPFLYQGEELGLTDGVIAAEDLEDPVATRNEGAVGRDGCRTAMPWDGSHQNGFTTAPRPWLPAASRGLEETVAGQRGVDGSFLNRYRELLAVRSTLPDLWDKELVWLETPGDEAAAYVRGDTAVATNLEDEPVTLELPGKGWRPAFVSRSSQIAVDGSVLTVPAATSVILHRRP